MLQNDVYNAGGANTVSSADPNDNAVDDFVTTIVRNLASEVARSAGQRAINDPEHGQKSAPGQGSTDQSELPNQYFPRDRVEQSIEPCWRTKGGQV